ncbi:Casparian strip membrane protein 1 [Rhynchospora pubera]|uniref:CASP-like protein n=1 Tax=Rhynchospora pubera TaxID=906938 RepID=A0AAV8HJH6_9POAL|nr:Casparian strip membrane protein 1 [Rhynchospora pubera]KAJ4818038.1 Casparian strip membrane protein 1 [Rhynchospora pubera]
MKEAVEIEQPLSSTQRAVVVEKGESSRSRAYVAPGLNRGISIIDLVLRLVALVGTLGSAIAMGTTNETLPFFTQFIQFRAEYNDLPSFTFFVIANSVVCTYLVLSIPLAIVHVIRSSARHSRLILIFFDTAMLALLTAGASAAAAIVYLAHKGNVRANWFAICQQFNSFCERISGSLIGSFAAIVVMILLIFLSSFALVRH